MLRILIEKEWKSVLLSPKFALSFLVCAVLILLSIGVGIREYHSFARSQSAAARLLDEEHREQTSWRGLTTQALRQPDPMQIFVAGVNSDVGRLAPITTRTQSRLQQSIYSEDTILAVFRSFDLSFIVQVILSLFAILFTYDSINGERESGTLKLIFSSAIPRARFVLGKLAGTWLGLALPLLLPFLLGALLVVLLRVPLSAEHWGKLGVFVLASGLYFTFFIVLGVAVSALTRRPSTSFLILLASWVILVLVIPRVGLLAAVRMVQVPTVAEIESQRAGFEQRAWSDYNRELLGQWRQRNAATEGLSEEQQQVYEDEHLWQWLEEDEESRTAVETVVAEYAAKLSEDLRNRKTEQERLAFSLSRLSPASTYQLVAMNLAGTDVAVKTRYEDQARRYRDEFIRFKEQESGASGNRVVRRHGSGGGGFLGGSSNQPLDLGGMPQFQPPEVSFSEAISSTPWDLGLLVMESLFCFVVGFVGFLRYDVR